MSPIRFVGVLTALFLASAIPLAALATDPTPYGGWHSDTVFPFAPSLSDEFTGTTVDSNKWNTDVDEWWTGNTFLPANTTVSNGYAQMTAKVDQTLGVSLPILKSIQKVKYGYFEARIQTANANLDSAFWLTNFGVQPNGDPWREIDTLEQYGSHTATERRTAHMSVHVPESQTEPQITQSYTFPSYLGSNYDLPTTYHYYGVNWNPSTITFYIDGVQRFQISGTDAAKFNVPLFVMLNTQNFTWLGDPTSQLPATMSVDYVRVWSDNVIAVAEPSNIKLSASALIGLLAYAGLKRGWSRPLNCVRWQTQVAREAR